jgi:hypothetical protein
MNENKKCLRDRLLASETINPTHREKYEKELHMLLEQKLIGARKWATIGAGVLGIVFTILFSTCAIMAPKEFPWLGRVGFAAGALFGLGWAISSARMLKKGSFHLKIDATIQAGLSWGVVVVMVTIFMLMAPGDKLWGVQMVLNGVVFLIAGAVFLLRNCIEQSELRTREKLLELEYRLEQMAEFNRQKPAKEADSK